MGYFEIFKTAVVVATGITLVWKGANLIIDVVKGLIPTESKDFNPTTATK